VEKVSGILANLACIYPEARTELHFQSPFQLLVATILSAQTTDSQVNKVTPPLFQRYPTPYDLAQADPEEVESLISSVGLYRVKARYLVGASRTLVQEYGGEVPERFEDLITLPGVGRKTAKVVLANAFAVPGMPVDTHVFRVARRLGLSQGTNPKRVEQDLEQIIPRELLVDTHHRLIVHGRSVCRAKNPLCHDCTLSPYCSSFNSAAAK
jgi:endonuclease-3